MVDVGTPIITIDTGGGSAPAPTPRGRRRAGPAGRGRRAGRRPDRRRRAGRPDRGPGRLRPAEHRGASPSPAHGRRAAVPSAEAPRRCPRRRTAVRRCWPPRPTPAPSRSGTAASRSAGRPRRTRWRGDAAPAAGVAPGRGRLRPLAKPPVRKYAKDLGVDLTHRHRQRGRRRHHPRRRRRRGRRCSFRYRKRRRRRQLSVPEGREQRIPIKGVRKHTAAAMVASAFTAPHVTEFLTVDVTRTMKLRAAARRPARAGRRQGQPAAVRGEGAAARRRGGTRWSTARWDEAAQEIVVKDYVNLGIAAATPRGLVVPNIKDAGRLSLAELAGALAELTATAREGKTVAGGHDRRHDHDHQRRASSASTPARRSSTRGSRRSSPSVRSARCRGCTRARSCRGR